MESWEVGAEDIERSPKRVVEWGASDVVPHFHDGAGYHPMWAQEHYKHCLSTFSCTVHIHFTHVLLHFPGSQSLLISPMPSCRSRSLSVHSPGCRARSFSLHSRFSPLSRVSLSFRWESCLFTLTSRSHSFSWVSFSYTWESLSLTITPLLTRVSLI